MNGVPLDRFWLLTWTTYGTWMPGDVRGFVSNVRDGPGPEVRHNAPGTPYDADDARVRQRAWKNLVGRPVYLTAAQAAVVAGQLRKTAEFCGWQLPALAIMANHIHVVVGVEGDPEPARLMHDFKSYASRALRLAGQAPSGGRWWTESGSRRKLKDAEAVTSAVRYVMNQRQPLVVWQEQEPRQEQEKEQEHRQEQGVDTPRSPGVENA